MKNKNRSFLGSLVADATLSVRASFSGMLSDDNETRALNRRVLSVRRSYLDANDASIADACTALAHNLYAGSAADCLEASWLMEEAHRILRLNYGNSVRVAKAAHLRGKISSRLRNFSLASELHEEAEVTYKRVCPLSYVRAANLLCQAIVYRQTNRPEEAALKQQESDDLYLILMASSPKTIPC